MKKKINIQVAAGKGNVEEVKKILIQKEYGWLDLEPALVKVVSVLAAEEKAEDVESSNSKAVAIATLLLDAGANPNYTVAHPTIRDYSISFLHYAVNIGHSSLVRVLVNKGANAI